MAKATVVKVSALVKGSRVRFHGNTKAKALKGGEFIVVRPAVKRSKGSKSLAALLRNIRNGQMVSVAASRTALA